MSKEILQYIQRVITLAGFPTVKLDFYLWQYLTCINQHNKKPLFLLPSTILNPFSRKRRILVYKNYSSIRENMLEGKNKKLRNNEKNDESGSIYREVVAMLKTYTDLMNDISADELYERLLAYGLFAEKLPPVFSSVDFYNYCQNKSLSFADNWKQYIYYESVRNINVPRSFGIPNPMAYQKLCRCLSDNWDNLKQHFEQQTAGQDYKISRIHIRKRNS